MLACFFACNQACSVKNCDVNDIAMFGGKVKYHNMELRLHLVN